MKEGKLFGKLHILDLLVILALVAAMGVFAWDRLGPQDPVKAAVMADMVVEVVVPGAEPEIIEEMERQDIVGKQLISGNSHTSAVIEEVRLEDYTVSADTDEGLTVEATDPTKKNIVIRIKAPVQRDAPSLIVAGQEVRVGRYLTVKTETFSVDGSISYVQVGDEQ